MAVQMELATTKTYALMDTISEAAICQATEPRANSQVMIRRATISLLKKSRSFASSSAATKTSIKSAADAKSSQAAPSLSHKMPPPRPILTPLQKRTSPFESTPCPNWSTTSTLPTSNSIHPFPLPSSQLQSKLSKDLKSAAELFGDNYLVWRSEVMNQLAQASQKSSHLILDGSRGVGKSALLLQLFVSLQETYKNEPNKLLLFAPDAAKWTTGFFSYYPVENSASFEQPDLALEILKLLLWSNPGKELPFTLEQVKEAAKDPLSLAGPLYNRVFAELKASGKHLTVLVDGVNGLLAEDSKTGYFDPNGQALPLSSFPLCRDFSKQADVFIGALTRSNPLLPSASIPKSNFASFKVPKYSDSELQSVLEMYKRLGHLTASSGLTEQFVALKAFISGRNARLLFKSCEYDAIYCA